MDTHNHGSETATSQRPLQMALVLVLVIMVAEVIGGIISHSLALLSDAGHMAIDALALTLSLVAMSIARKPATTARTYGYHRYEILAALANGITVGLISLFIFYQAYQRLLAPPEVDIKVMLPVAIIGLIANIVGVFLLRGGSAVSLNVRSAFWHIVGDTISSVGVIAAAIIISFTGQKIADPVIAIVIGLIVLWGAIGLVRESIHILSDAVPRHIPVDKVIEAIKTIPGVVDVHDIHIWTLTSGVHALSAHVLITDQMVSRSTVVIQTAQEDLKKQFDITHATLQLECEKCESCPDGAICDIRRQETHEGHHH